MAYKKKGFISTFSILLLLGAASHTAFASDKNPAAIEWNNIQPQVPGHIVVSMEETIPVAMSLQNLGDQFVAWRAQQSSNNAYLVTSLDQGKTFNIRYLKKASVSTELAAN